MGSTYGRDAVIDALAAAPAGLHVVTGTSGMGKSIVIGSAAHHARAVRCAPAPVKLESADGSLQRALLSCLSEGWTTHLEEHRGSAPHLVRKLQTIGHRLGDAGARAVGKVVVDELLAVAKAKLGDQVGAATFALVKDILSAEDRSLLQRLRTSADPDILAAFLLLATEVATLLERPLTLSLDQAERLSDPDRALLTDLPERLQGSGITVIAALNSDLPANQDFTRNLIGRGALEHRLHPIGQAALEQWLQAAAVPRARWGQVASISSRVPFDVRDAIDLVARGDDLNELPADEPQNSLADSLWQSLDREARERAMMLSILRVQPTDDYVCALLECTSVQWAAIRHDFVTAGVFVANDGDGWFHDRRRSWIWSTALRDGQRQEIAARHVAAAGTFLSTQPSIPYWLIALMGTICSDSAYLSSDVDLIFTTIAGLSAESLAVVFALIELEEKDAEHGGFAPVHMLAAHAATVVESPAVQASAFEELSEHALIASAANDRHAIAKLSLPTQLAVAAVLGRISDVFHRFPVPHVASTAFDSILRPAAPQFENGFVGIGTTSPQLQFAQLQAKDTHPQLIAIAIAGTAGDRPFAAAMSFPTVDDRDQATRALTGLNRDFSGDELLVQSIVPLPGPPLRSQRYILLRKTLATELQEKTRPLGLTEERQLKVAVLEALRLGMSPLEAAVTGHTRPHAILTAEFDRSVLDFHVSGGEARHTTIEPTENLTRGPWVEVHLRAAGALRPGEHVNRTHYRDTKNDTAAPSTIFAEIETRLSDALTAMSRLQPATTVAVDEITPHILHMRSLLREDLARLRAAGLPITGELPARRILLTVAPSTNDFGETLDAVTYFLPANEDSVELARLDQFPADRSLLHENIFQEAWASTSADVSEIMDGSAQDILCYLTGFDPYRDIRIIADRE